MIPFNKPSLVGQEVENILNAVESGQLAGDGKFTNYCHTWLEKNNNVKKALLTHSCTAALEMAALLIDIKAGDEIIMPSYTFVSSANSFVLRGGVPVFIDIRNDTLNLDENLIESSITKRTKAIMPVHYAGVSCEMTKITDIAKKYGLYIVEDAAQGICAKYKNKPLGSMGDLGCLSFHETKNIHCGEGGALLINNSKFAKRAEILREKGTNRSEFFRGEVDKYNWVDIGSSYLPGELSAAFLYAQLEKAKLITKNRVKVWKYYNDLFEQLENQELLRRPIIPNHCEHNGHIYYILLNKRFNRNEVINKLKEKGIYTVFHYLPLHDSKAGEIYSRTPFEISNTNDISSRIIRLPIWNGIKNVNIVFEGIKKILI